MLYHTVSGTDITVYLKITVDPNDNFHLDTPLFAVLNSLAKKWHAIATALQFRLIVAPAEDPELDPELAPADTALFGDTTSTARVLFYNEKIEPPSGVVAFNLHLGLKDTRNPQTQGSKTSYIDSENNYGYIYSQTKPPGVDLDDVAHEMGHILGLVDRYYQALVWNTKQAIDRKCRQIRRGDWFAFPHKDMRVPLSDVVGDHKELPRWAARIGLIMHRNAMPKDQDGNSLDADYDPADNLMSSTTARLSKYQLSFIGIKDGKAQPPQREPKIRTINWIAILGNLAKTDHFPTDVFAWDTGKGLKFHPENKDTIPAKDLPCWNGTRCGVDDHGRIFRNDLIQQAKGKRDEFETDTGTKKIKWLKKPPDESYKREWMCYSKRLLSDMEHE